MNANLGLGLTVSASDDLVIEEFGQSSYSLQAALYTQCIASSLLVTESAQHA
ncbi:hypothetical protein OG432_23405 [Streptomyces sp. NBC_00442]|uniref:hypothetical protein n=1 Tax=Streptomyces sp. NBC_00442 TaxID=2903651 RepID=UPI002E1CCB8B